MNPAQNISLISLGLMFIPVVIVAGVYFRWGLNYKIIITASIRMLVQLIVIGYALVVIFKQTDPLVSSLILLIMLSIAGWIALRPLSGMRRELYAPAFLSIFSGALPVLILVVAGVIRLDPWYMPRYLIPLAGMAFANSMNSVSLCAERFYAEIRSGKSYTDARNAAYQAGLLPGLNAFFAVGLVSLPGMMTGQILAGASPLLAVRYQIMVMCMVLGGSGISSMLFLLFMRKHIEK